jgi:hypothetical protein
LQLNLPATSVRDFQVFENDLIVGTHGRGIWVIDDISPLRQLTDAVLSSDAYLFKPADAIDYTRGGDNGTPLQKDEPQAMNPPAGAAIDFYLKSAGGAVTLEILDAAGAVVQTWSTEAGSAPTGGGRGGRGGGGGIPNTSPLWRSTPESFTAAAGMHRVNWVPGGGGRGGRGGRGGGPAVPTTGTFTAKLTASGRSYTQAFTIRPDPRRTEP